MKTLFAIILTIILLPVMLMLYVVASATSDRVVGGMGLLFILELCFGALLVVFWKSALRKSNPVDGNGLSRELPWWTGGLVLMGILLFGYFVFFRI